MAAYLAQGMGFEYAILFPSAREALRAYSVLESPVTIPSNVCLVLKRWATTIVPVNEWGTAPGTQIYGFREIHGEPLDIDPLMTGWFGEPFSLHSVVSFGRHKTVSVGAGGAFLTNDRAIYVMLKGMGYFPEGLLEALEYRLLTLPQALDEKWRITSLWDRHLGDMLLRFPLEQVVPWRVMRICAGHLREKIVWELRKKGYPVSVNYPPLPGVTDPVAVRFGEEVLNFPLDVSEFEIVGAAGVIRKVLNG